MSQAMRKLAGNLNRTNTVCLFTNQIREKVGVQFGSPETQPGGRALKFYSSQRLDIRRIETLKEGTEAVGNRVRVKVVKNKVASPFRQAEFDIEYGVGISREGGLLDFGIEHDLVQKSGSFFSYGETRLGQGRNNAKQFLTDNPELAAELETKIRTALGIGTENVVPVEESRAASRGDLKAAKDRRAHRSSVARARNSQPEACASGLRIPRRMDNETLFYVCGIVLAVSAVVFTFVALRIDASPARRSARLRLVRRPRRRRDHLLRSPCQGRGKARGGGPARGDRGSRRARKKAPSSHSNSSAGALKPADAPLG